MDVKYSKPALFQHGGKVEAEKLGPAAAAWRGVIEPAGVYLECLRNHAASVGGLVVDGCGEFMPAAEPPNPASLRCAACGCHRSFHRRAVAEGPPPPPPPPPRFLCDDRPPRGEGTPEDREPGADAEDGGEEMDEGSDYDEDRPMSPLPAPAMPRPGCFAITSASEMLFLMRKGVVAKLRQAARGVEPTTSSAATARAASSASASPVPAAVVQPEASGPSLGIRLF